jgi:hypothetical protein
MTETAHKSFIRTPKVLALLPLILMAAGVWYYVAKHGGTGPAPAPVSADFNFGGKAPAPAAKTRRHLSAGGPAPENGPFITDAALEVKGDDNFKSQVTHSLKLIWLSDREDFLFIKKYLSVIRNEDKTEFYLDNGRPVAALSKAQANRSLTWCAGLIAHQAFHSYIKFNSKKKQKVRPPLPGEKDEREFLVNPAAFDYTSLNSILNMEARACSFQMEVLRKIGAPRREINALVKRAPRDFSVSHDGNYSIKP